MEETFSIRNRCDRKSNALFRLSWRFPMFEPRPRYTVTNSLLTWYPLNGSIAHPRHPQHASNDLSYYITKSGGGDVGKCLLARQTCPYDRYCDIIIHVYIQIPPKICTSLNDDAR